MSGRLALLTTMSGWMYLLAVGSPLTKSRLALTILAVQFVYQVKLDTSSQDDESSISENEQTTTSLDISHGTSNIIQS